MLCRVLLIVHKSSFAAAVAEDIRARNVDDHIAVISLFLGHLEGPMSPEIVLRLILAQLLQHRGGGVSDWRDTDVEDIKLQSLRAAVIREMGRFSGVYMVVDGLDFISEELVYKSIEEELTSLTAHDAGSRQVLSLMLVQTRFDIDIPTYMRCDASGDNCCIANAPTFWQCEQCEDPAFQVCYPCYDDDHRCPDS